MQSTGFTHQLVPQPSPAFSQNTPATSASSRDTLHKSPFPPSTSIWHGTHTSFHQHLITPTLFPKLASSSTTMTRSKRRSSLLPLNGQAKRIRNVSTNSIPNAHVGIANQSANRTHPISDVHSVATTLSSLNSMPSTSSTAPAIRTPHPTSLRVMP